MKAYKGFDKDLKCRGFQYEVGKEYEEEKAVACECGFHACENPLDVFNYYTPADGRFCEVEQGGEIDKSSDDSKVASTKIKIKAEIGINGIIKAGVRFILDHVKFDTDKKFNTGYQSAATNTGYQSAATVGKGGSVAIALGYNSKAKADIGSAIVIAERGEWNGDAYPLFNIKSAIVDGVKLKANTFYTVRNNEFIECD